MKVTTHQQYPRWILLLPILAVLAALPAVRTLEWTPPSHSSPHPTSIYAHPAFNVIGNGSFYYLDANGFMPDIPSCKHLGHDTCRWVIRASESGTFYDINLVGDKGRVLMNAQISEMDAGHAGYYAFTESDTIWISAVRVARLARNNGLGKLAIDAINAMLAYIAKQDGIEAVYHAFVDTAGWGNTMLRHIMLKYEVVYHEAEVFIYEVLAS